MRRGFDSGAHLYDSRRRAPRTVELDALLRAFYGHRRILDIGGGTGRYARPLVSAGHEVALLDLSRGMLAEARAKGLPWTVRGTAARLPFCEEAFDGAFFVELLHLVREWPAVIRELGRVTRGPISAIMRVRNPDLRWIYTESRSKLGHPTGLLDHGINALAEILPPRRVEELWADRSQVDAVTAFRGFEAPEQAPPGVHAAALERVRLLFGSTHLGLAQSARLVVWNPEDFRQFTYGA